jgi:hypothetical protein
MLVPPRSTPTMNCDAGERDGEDMTGNITSHRALLTRRALARL